MLKRKKYLDLLDREHLPSHIGIIMDGNGRWAKKRGMPRSFGHSAGAKTFDKIIDFAGNLGIKVVTVYAFSTENWNRPKDEVDSIMKLLKEYLDTGLKKLEGKDTRVKIIGDIPALPRDIQDGILHIENATRDGQSMLVQIALNYGGRQEIVQAAQKAAAMVKDGTLALEQLDEACLSRLMYAPDVPDPDLIIRPSGEYRLSNFLLWGSAYAEFWFSDILWPDFTGEDLAKAIYDYQKRSRRFGGV